MASGSKICPECGALNGSDADVCVRCGVRFPGAIKSSATSLWEAALGREAPITRLYVALCVAVYALTILTGGEFDFLGGLRTSDALRWGGTGSCTGAYCAAYGMNPELTSDEPWRLLSAMFVHFGILHLGFNMMALVDLGKFIERLVGSARFAVLLGLTVIAGFWLSHLYYAAFPREIVITGGISGGLFGLVAAMIGYLYARKDPAWKQMFVRLLIYSVLFAVAFPVNNAAHAGGFLAGLPLGYFFYREGRPWRLERVFRGLATALVICSVLSVLATNASDTWRVARAAEIQREGYEAVVE